MSKLLEKRVLFDGDKMLLEEILIAPEKTALVVIDAVNDIFADSGRYAQKEWNIKPLQEMFEKSLLPLIDKLKIIIPVVFVKSAYTPNQFINDEHPITDFCVEGTEGADFYKLNPRDAAYIYSKRQHSALFELPYEEERTTELHKWLQGKGTRQLIITGATNTNCIPVNVKHALQLEYEVIVPKDCIASRGERIEGHEANLMWYINHRGINVVDSKKIKYRL